MKSGNAIKGLLILAAIMAVLLLPIGWAILQWFECREMGHSILYCIGHISR